jgi:hypothetical protein
VHQAALVRKLPFILGPLLILAGGWLVLMVLGFSSMVDPDLEGWAQWRAFLLSDPPTLISGLGLIGLGFWVAASGGRKPDEHPPGRPPA